MLGLPRSVTRGRRASSQVRSVSAAPAGRRSGAGGRGRLCGVLALAIALGTPVTGVGQQVLLDQLTWDGANGSLSMSTPPGGVFLKNIRTADDIVVPASPSASWDVTRITG